MIASLLAGGRQTEQTGEPTWFLVLTIVLAALSAAGTLLAAIAAWRSAKRSADAADKSSRALAEALAPPHLDVMGSWQRDWGHFRIDISSRYGRLLDVIVEVSMRGRVLGRKEFVELLDGVPVEYASTGTTDEDVLESGVVVTVHATDRMNVARWAYRIKVGGPGHGIIDTLHGHADMFARNESRDLIRLL